MPDSILTAGVPWKSAVELQPGDRYERGTTVYRVVYMPDPGGPEGAGPMVAAIRERDGARVTHEFGRNAVVRMVPDA